MFIPCIIRRTRRNQQYALIVPLLYSTCWLLHVSAVACHPQGAYWILLSYVKYKRRVVYLKYITDTESVCVTYIESIDSICFILHDVLYILILYLLYILDIPPSVCISRNSGGSNNLPDEGRLLPKHVGANT
jgi:hypothetical protein